MHWTLVHDFPESDVKERWDSFLVRADFPAYYVSPEYFREPFLRDKRPFAILVWDKGCIVGALTGLREGTELLSGFPSRPQTCFDMSADKAKVSECFAAALTAEAGDASLVTVFTWCELDTLQKLSFRHRIAEGVVMLDLTVGADALFKGFSANRRSNIRKALKGGLDVSIAATTDEFRAYYEISVEWSREKKLPFSTWEVAQEALMLSGNRKLFIARFGERIIAGVVIRMHPTGMVVYAANSSLKESLPLKPNDVLHWRVIEWACQEGYKRYNLGGAHLFLRKMGGEVVRSHRYRLDRTLLHRHEMKELLRSSSSKVFHAMPGKVQQKFRRVLGRTG